MKKLFELFGTLLSWRSRGDTLRDGFTPYANKDCNALYNSLFCDKLHVLRQDPAANTQVWTTVLAEQPFAAALRDIANDHSQESRARAVAYMRLRELQQAVPTRILLGVIIEVGLGDGLDVLAAYPDGRVRYINHKESVTTHDPVPNDWLPKVRRLLNAASEAVDRIGPWLQPRIAPPTAGAIRMSFLVSDGLYFGQGPMAVMEKDEMAQPIIAASVDLLKVVAKDFADAGKPGTQA